MQIITRLHERLVNVTARELAGQISRDPCASRHLKDMVHAQYSRDVLDALRDAEIALAHAHKRAAEMGVLING